MAFLTESSASRAPTFSARPLGLSSFSPRAAKWGVRKLFLASLLRSVETAKKNKTSRTRSSESASEPACSYSPSLLVPDINNDEFLIRRNKQLAKNVTEDTARAGSPPGASFESYPCHFLPVVYCCEDPVPSCRSLCSSLVSGGAE